MPRAVRLQIGRLLLLGSGGPERWPARLGFGASHRSELGSGPIFGIVYPALFNGFISIWFRRSRGSRPDEFAISHPSSWLSARRAQELQGEIREDLCVNKFVHPNRQQPRPQTKPSIGRHHVGTASGMIAESARAATPESSAEPSPVEFRICIPLF